MPSVRCEYFISVIQSSLSRLCKFSLDSFSSDVCERDVSRPYPTVRIQLAEYKGYCHVNRNCLPFMQPFPFYVGSMFLVIRFQLIRHCVSSPDSSLSDKSFLMLSNHLRFGLPLLLVHGTSITIILLPTHPSSLLNTCPYHFKLRSCTFYDSSPTFSTLLILPSLIMSTLVTQLIHLKTLIHFRHIL